MNRKQRFVLISVAIATFFIIVFPPSYNAGLFNPRVETGLLLARLIGVAIVGVALFLLFGDKAKPPNQAQKPPGTPAQMTEGAATHGRNWWYVFLAALPVLGLGTALKASNGDWAAGFEGLVAGLLIAGILYGVSKFAQWLFRSRDARAPD